MTPAERQAASLAETLKKLNDSGELENLEHADEQVQAIHKHLKKHGHHKAADAMAKGMGVGHPNDSGNPLLTGQDIRKGKKASVTVKISRTITKGNAILVDGSGQPVPLPAPLFGVLEYESNYSRVFAQFLPKDGSVKVRSFGKTADSQSLIIVFQSADDSVEETVIITGTNTVWTNLLRGLSSSLFNIVNAKLIIGDVLRINQFDQPVNIFIGSMFTASNYDNISPQDYKPEALSDNTVRVLRDTLPVTPEKTIVPMIVPSTVTNANGSSFYYTLTLPLGDIRKDV